MVRRRVRHRPSRPGPATRGGPVGGHGPTCTQEGAQGGGSLSRETEHAGGPAGAQHIGVVDAISAGATRVIILSPVFARPGAPPVRRSWGRPRRRARVATARHWPPGGGPKAIWMRSGWLRGSIYRVLLFWDRFSVSKPLSQIQRRTLLFLQQASFGGLGLRLMRRASV